jgi:hypothetical protein
LTAGCLHQWQWKIRRDLQNSLKALSSKTGGANRPFFML